MALARYLHFAFTLNTVSNITALRGLEVYDASSTDLTVAVGVGGFNSQSSKYDGTTTYQGLNVFDHNDTTLWAGAVSDPGWLRYDLGATRDVRSVVARARNDITGQTPLGITVYGSTSGFPTNASSYGMDTLAPQVTMSQTLGASTTVAIGATASTPFVPATVSRVAQVLDSLSRGGPQPDRVIRVHGGNVVDFKGTFGGRGYISGHTYVTGTPNTIDPFARVGLYKEAGGFVTSMFSDAAGFYQFSGLDTTLRYFVVLFDDTHNYNAAIKDNLTPLT